MRIRWSINIGCTYTLVAYTLVVYTCSFKRISQQQQHVHDLVPVPTVITWVVRSLENPRNLRPGLGEDV